MSWLLANIPQVEAHLIAHLLQVVPAVLATFVLSLPLARLAQRVAPLRALIVSGASLMYAIPSLALFVILPLVLGTGIRDVANVVVALTLYGLALLVPTAVEALEAVDRHGDAAAVVDAHDIDAGAGQRAGDRDDGDLGGQHAQTGGAERGGDHDQRLAAVAQEGLGGPPVIDRSDHGGQHQLVPAGLRGRVQAVDDLGVKGLVHPEGDPDEPRARRSQGARPLVGAVAQARGDRLDPAPSLLRGPGGVPHDDRGQGDRAVGLAGDIDERHLPGAPP